MAGRLIVGGGEVVANYCSMSKETQSGYVTDAEGTDGSLTTFGTRIY